jgi:hypothetical protein
MIIHYATVVADLDRARVMGLLAADDRLRGFVRDGRIAAIPVKQAKRLLLLDAVAQAFEPGVRYSEAVVSGFLATVHDDYAALRRYLVDGEFLSRDHGEYWRTAGTVDLRAPGRPAQVPGPGPASQRRAFQSAGQPAAARATSPAWRSWLRVQPLPAGSSGRVAAVKISAARR